MSIRITFVLVMFLAVVAGYFFYYEPGPSEDVVPRAPWFYTSTMEDIKEIRVTTHQGEEATFRRDEEKQWRFVDEFEMPVGLDRWGGVTLLLSGPATRRALAPTVDDPVKYGLAEPSATIDVALTGDRQVRVQLGAKTPDNLNYYVIQEGNPGLFIIDGGWGDILTNLATELPYPEWYYKLDPSLLLLLGITHGESEVKFVPAGDDWRFASGEQLPVDAERWEEVKPLLSGPPSLHPLAKEIDEHEKYGLKEPATIIRIDYSPPFPANPDDPNPELRRSFKLLIGDQLPDASGYYAQVEEQPFLLFVDSSWYDVMVRLATSPPIQELEDEKTASTS